MSHGSQQRNTAVVRTLHEDMRRCTDSITAALADDAPASPARIRELLAELEGLLGQHASESSTVCDMADRMFSARGSGRHSDSVRRLAALVRVAQQELRTRNGSATRQEIARRAFAIGALVRALVEVEALVVLDPIDRLAPQVFAASAEAGLLGRERKRRRRSARSA